MKLAPWPLSRNVVSANAARPSGAGSAAGTPSMSVTGRSWARTAILSPSFSAPAGRPPAVVGDEQDVLQPDAAVARAIQAGLERDHVSGDEIVADDRQPRALVHLEADAVAEPVEEAAVEHLARLLRQLRRIPVLGEEVAC